MEVVAEAIDPYEPRVEVDPSLGQAQEIFSTSVVEKAPTSIRSIKETTP